MQNCVLVNPGTPMKPVEMWEYKWWSWHESEAQMRRNERRNTMWMKWCVEISLVDKEWLKCCIRSVDKTRNECLKLAQPGNSQWPGGWFGWNCWGEWIRTMRFDLTICSRVSLLQRVVFLGFLVILEDKRKRKGKRRKGRGRRGSSSSESSSDDDREGDRLEEQALQARPQE